MTIIDNLAEWSGDFESGWLAYLEQNGKADWKKYRYVRNRTPVSAGGIDPASARLLLISTAGAFLRDRHEAFDTANPRGDYSVRTFPADTPFADLEYAHEHYDHAARKEDPQVNLPLGYLADMAANGRLGSLADNVVSYAGYQPDVRAVVAETVPEVKRLASRERARAALLVPV